MILLGESKLCEQLMWDLRTINAVAICDRDIDGDGGTKLATVDDRVRVTMDEAKGAGIPDLLFRPQ